MLIDLELLRNASQSPYRRALERGYRRLYFEPDLESEFQSFYTEGQLTRVRMAAWLGIIIFSIFVGIDLISLPLDVSVWTIGIRLGVIIPGFIFVLIISYRAVWRGQLARALFIAAITTGLGTVALIAAGLSRSYPIPYEGILLVALFIYLVACLQWWRALLANAVILLAFVLVEFTLQTDAQARLYQVVFMLAANAIGAYGGYFLEYSARTMFLVNTLLNELAELDGLTKLPNRRTLDVHLDRLWRQGLREKKCIAIAMIDIDYFKRYNDRYGHAKGDEALKAVAQAVGALGRRPLDLCARYGGEEFAVVWFDPVAGELQRMGEAIGAAVTQLGIEHLDSDSGRLSISIGVAHRPARADQSITQLLELADSALYRAKESGRDRTIVLS